MSMTAQGLAKLIEECGELVQVCAKKLAYYGVAVHPDGKGDLHERMEEEIADVLAAAKFVVERFRLDQDRIEHRFQAKLAQYEAWHRQKYNDAGFDSV